MNEPETPLSATGEKFIYMPFGWSIASNPMPEPFIGVPSGWDETADRREYEGHDLHDYPQGIAEELSTDYEEFNDVLNNALAYFARDLPARHLIGPILSAQDKIDLLISRVHVVSLDPKVRHRLLQDLARCNWIESERRRLLLAYLQPSAVVWTEPMCTLDALMVGAAMQLEESLICEFDDYTEPLTYHPRSRYSKGGTPDGNDAS